MAQKSTKKTETDKKPVTKKSSTTKVEAATKVAKNDEQKPTTPVVSADTKNPTPVTKKADKSTEKDTKADKSTEVTSDQSPESSAQSAKPSAPKKAPSKAKTMEELLKETNYQFHLPQKGGTVKGIVRELSRKSVVVDIGGKTEGVITDKEYAAASDFIEQLKVGDTVEAYVISSENERGQVLLSLKKAALDTKWQEFEAAFASKATVSVKGLEVNRGGLIVAVDGIRGFIPSSQFGPTVGTNFAALKGKKVDVKVIEVDREKNRLIFSEKHVSEAGELQAKAAALDNIKVGEVYEGVVSGVMHFGLFVSVTIPGKKKEDDATVEGLVHISEISWEKVNDPRDYYKVADAIKVKVLGVEKESGKLNLSIKQMGNDPWTGVADNYPVGTTITGKVSRVAPFGVFVRVEPGVDGLIHSSKLSPDQFYGVGDDVTVTVESVEPASRRMSLSIVLTEVPIGYK